MKKNKKVLIIGLIFILTLSLMGCSTKEGADKEQKIVAEYEGGNVTEEEFNKFLNVIQFFNPESVKDMNEESKKQALEEYIAGKYISDQVKEKDEEGSKAMLDMIKGQRIQALGSEEEYEKFLKNLNISEDDLLEYINKFNSVQTYFVQRKYKENKEDFTIATVSHILITIDENRTEEEAKKRADEVLAKAKAGEDFAGLAKEYSDDPGSKDNGGKYEDAPIMMYVPEFKEATLTLPLNEVSDLVKTQFGDRKSVV